MRPRRKRIIRHLFVVLVARFRAIDHFVEVFRSYAELSGDFAPKLNVDNLPCVGKISGDYRQPGKLQFNPAMIVRMSGRFDKLKLVEKGVLNVSVPIGHMN